MKRLSLRLVTIVLFAVALPAIAQDQSGDLAARVDKVFEQYDKPISPGCALAVIKDGQIVYQRGYGMADLDHDIPIKPDTV
ncbi:MAG: serine hydrolase, partial [Blastocatellia bacterium]